MLKNSFFHFIITILSLVLLFFVLAPIFNLVFGSSADILLETIKEKEVYNTILRTFKASLVATLFSILLAVPLAYLLARFDFPGKVLIEGLMNLPVIIPHTAAGIALLTVFGNSFFLGKFFSNFNISFVGEFAGIVIAMMFVSMPFLLNDAIEGFRSIDIRLEKVARSLGASPAQTFFKIALPLNFSHIISGSLMMWARGLSEFGAVTILAYHPMSAPVLIYERFTSFGLKYSRPIAAIMVIASLIVFIILRLVNSKMSSIENRSEG
ncbi:MAG: ABC transporter permease subunit [Bacillota bacterium]